MFIWNFLVEKLLEEIGDWIYIQIMTFLSEFFGMLNHMGAELFEYVWIKGLVQFFSYLAWALFTVGLVVSVFETAIAYQNGQGNIGGTFIK